MDAAWLQARTGGISHVEGPLRPRPSARLDARSGVLRRCFGWRRSTGAQAQQPASVIVVFDGSGSMWGPIEGTKAHKVVLARDAVRRALARIGPQTRVGLVAFGHRRGDCGDVELLRPLEPLDVPRFTDTLGEDNPRGRGPLTTALREAAKSMPPGPGRRSLVLIHDDADNCQQNVCAAAEELRRAGIVAHVRRPRLEAERRSDHGVPAADHGRTAVQCAHRRADRAGVDEALRLAGSAAPSVDAPVVTAAVAPPPALAPGAAAIPPWRSAGALPARPAARPKTEPVSLPLAGRSMPRRSRRRSCSRRGRPTRTSRWRPAATWWRRATGRSPPA